MTRTRWKTSLRRTGRSASAKPPRRIDAVRSSAIQDELDAVRILEPRLAPQPRLIHGHRGKPIPECAEPFDPRVKIVALEVDHDVAGLRGRSVMWSENVESPSGHRNRAYPTRSA